MSEEQDQMGLFEPAGAAPTRQAQPVLMAPPSPAAPPKSRAAALAGSKSLAPARAAGKSRPAAAAVSAPPVRKVSGLVPEGDVRLTANIRQDLHLKLKISSAHRRTTIGEILEELIEKHL